MFGQKTEAAFGATDIVGNSAHERDGYIVLFCPFRVPSTTAFSAHNRQLGSSKRQGGRKEEEEERQGGEEMRTAWELLKFIDVEQKGGRQKDTKGRAAVLTSGSSSNNRQLTRYSIPNTEDKNTGGPRSCIQESHDHLDSPDCWTRDNPTCPAMS